MSYVIPAAGLLAPAVALHTRSSALRQYAVVAVIAAAVLEVTCWTPQ
ncbi:hypothetical protein OG824_31760 [Streptomyces prunicolor]|nr:hypothetical protein [Streptomyces prunicolor]MCX5239787.1 hypothetical protein [Streptomyces prunicolor]